MPSTVPLLPAGHGPDDQKRLSAGRDCFRQQVVGGFVREILLAGKEPHERAALVRDLVTDRPAQHRVARLERVEDRALGGFALDVELHLALDARERPKMSRQYHADHGRVWASTDTTGGRSRTIGAQLSPASAEPYIWPPLVPKYKPHGSSESTAIESRRTLTLQWISVKPFFSASPLSHPVR